MALQKGYNSFVTITEAESYFYDRLNQASWDSATDETVERALVTATGILDNLDWGGTATPTALYPLSFPRDITYWDTKSGGYETLEDDRSTTSYGTFPEDIKKATYELALHLIKNMSTIEDQSSGSPRLKDLKVGSISLTFDLGSGISNFNELPDHIQNIIVKFDNPDSSATNRGVKVSGGA
jgi:hypothetical protein